MYIFRFNPIRSFSVIFLVASVENLIISEVPLTIPLFTQRFRQDYRLERKLLAELDVDPSSHEGELSGLFAANDLGLGRHNISRVVVLHNDKIETFGDTGLSNSVPDDFFDNDSFWSGSITWY